jgi:hypothetical protein
MNESIAFAAGVVTYQSRLRAKLVLIERACGTVGSEGIAALDIRGRLVRFNCLARYHMDGQLIETGRAHPAPTHRSDVPLIVHPRPTVRDTISARG